MTKRTDSETSFENYDKNTIDLENTKVTEGEWKVESYNNDCYIIVTDKKQIAEIGANKANAKLIASAPELLEACKNITEGHGFNEGNLDDELEYMEISTMSLIKLQKAINKAEEST